MSDQQTSNSGTTGAVVTTASAASSAGGSSTPTQCTSTNNTTVGQMAVVTAAATTSQQQQQQQVRVVVSQQIPIAVPNTTQVTMTPALTQIVASQPLSNQVQGSSGATAGAVIRSSLPGTVQVIQGHPFMQQQYTQQQYYIQNVQAMPPQHIGQQMNFTALQARPTSSASQKSPVISAAPIGSQATVTLKTVAPSTTTAAATQTKNGPKTVLQQHPAVYGSAKQVIQGTPGQPLVIRQLGVLQNTGGSQTIVAQAKSPSVSVAAGGTTQVINNPSQIRFTNQQTFVTSQGHILSGTAMLNQLQMTPIQQGALPLGTTLLGSQSAVIGTQPLYLRPAGPIQTPQGIVGSVQAMIPTNKTVKQGSDNSGSVQMKSTGTQVKTVAPTQVRGVANILPQTARPFGQIPGSPTMAKGVQTGQLKQVSRVRAVRPTKTTIAQVTPASQPARIAPQPKAQNVQRTLPSTPTSQVVTVASVPIANTQTQTSTPKQVAVESTATVSPLKTPVSAVSQVKSDGKSKEVTNKEEEPMDTESSVIAEEETPPQTAASNTIVTPTKMSPTSAGAGGGSGMVGAGAGPEHKSTSATVNHTVQNSHKERNDRVAMVIGERQAAIVKPNILTHVIEGFVIQEATEPFPVQRCSTLSDFTAGRSSSQEADSGVEKDTDDSSSSSADSKQKPRKEIPQLKCEYCGIMASARRFGNSQRFCSRACAKRYNVGCTRRVGLFTSRKRNKLPAAVAAARKHKNLQMKRVWKRGQTGRVTTGPLRRTPEASPLTVDNIRTHTNTSQDATDGEADLEIGISGLGAPSTMSMETTTTTSDESERSTTPSGQDESSSPRSPPELERVEMDMDLCNPALVPRRHPSKWTVQEVVDFIRNLQGCSIYAEEFNRQEIDGQALMLLKEDHLMSTMNVKLGPALKICAKIKSLTEDHNTFNN